VWKKEYKIGVASKQRDSEGAQELKNERHVRKEASDDPREEIGRQKKFGGVAQSGRNTKASNARRGLRVEKSLTLESGGEQVYSGIWGVARPRRVLGGKAHASDSRDFQLRWGVSILTNA